MKNLTDLDKKNFLKIFYKNLQESYLFRKNSIKKYLFGFKDVTIEEELEGTKKRSKTIEIFSVYLELNSKIDIKTPSFVLPIKHKSLNFEFKGGFSKILTQKLVMEPVINKGIFQTNISDLSPYIQNEEDENWFYQTIENIVRDQGATSAYEYVALHKEGKLFSIAPKAITAIAAMEKLYNQLSPSFLTEVDCPYDIDSFHESAEIKDWFENQSLKKALVLLGPAGYGKTEYIKTLLVKKYKLQGHFFTNIQDFIKLNQNADFIICDDFDLEGIPLAQVQKLLDISNPGTINAKYMQNAYKLKI